MSSKSAHRRLALAGVAVLTGALVGVFGFGSPAGAHVTVSSPDAHQGGFAKLVFRVPNEQDAATMVKLEVHIPEDAPMGSARPKPKPGWTAQVTKGKLAKPVDLHGTKVTEGVTKITWTAANPAAGIPVGNFDEFEISGGPMPEIDSITLKAIETYSNGEVSRWIEETEEGGEEPEKPAPVLKLAKAEDAEHGDSGGEAAAAGESGGGSADEDNGGGAGTILGAIGLVAGLAGLALGGAAFLRTRRTAGPGAG